jgi:hypothetical protein
MYFQTTTKNREELKKEYWGLMKKWHPDQTQETFDTTKIAQEINLEYQRLLRTMLFIKDQNNNVTIDEDIENELKTARDIFVNVYKVHPRMGVDNEGICFKYHELEHIKTRKAYNELDAQKLIKNMRAMKLYEPYLSERKYDMCDRMGFIYRVEYGNVALKDFFESKVKDENKWRAQRVI